MANSQIPSGPATDAHGHVALDPTENVKLIVASAVRRGDDLRNTEARHTREILKLHTARSDDLRTSESDHLREISLLRANFYEELRDAESKRIDAIRAVDVGAVAAAAAVQLTQQNTLAATVASSAEAMRTQMQGQAQTVATTLDAKIAPLQSAIADLQRFQFESAGGKAQIVETRDASADMKSVFDAIANLTAAQSVAAGAQAQVVETRARGGSVGLWVGLGVAAAGLLASTTLAIAAIVVTLLLTGG